MKLKGKIKFITALTFFFITQAVLQDVRAQKNPTVAGESRKSSCESFYEECLTEDFFKKIEPGLYGKFCDISGEDAFARLDGFATMVQNSPANTTGYIVYYGGKINKYGEFKIRTDAVMNYLLKRRKLDPARFKLVSGGFREKFEFEMWLSPWVKIFPPLTPTIDFEKVKFKGIMRPLPLDLGN